MGSTKITLRVTLGASIRHHPRPKDAPLRPGCLSSLSRCTSCPLQPSLESGCPQPVPSPAPPAQSRAGGWEGLPASAGSHQLRHRLGPNEDVPLHPGAHIWPQEAPRWEGGRRRRPTSASPHRPPGKISFGPLPLDSSKLLGACVCTPSSGRAVWHWLRRAQLVAAPGGVPVCSEQPAQLCLGLTPTTPIWPQRCPG